MDTQKSIVFRPNEANEDPHPHACWDGWYTAFDTTIGGEAEFVEIVLCRRCEISLRKSKETEAGIEKYKAF